MVSIWIKNDIQISNLAFDQSAIGNDSIGPNMIFGWGVLKIGITNCKFFNSQRAGIRLDSPGLDTLSSEVVISNNIFNGVDCSVISFGVTNMTISGNTMINCVSEGVGCWYDAGRDTYYNYNVSISNNVISDANCGITLYKGRNCSITGNSITRTRRVGIKLLDTRNCSISGNSIYNCIDDSFSGGILSDLDSVMNITISGNIIDSCNGDGIALSSNIDDQQYQENLSIVGNSVTNCDKSGIKLRRCFNSIVANNISRSNDRFGLDVYSDSDYNVFVGNNISDNVMGSRAISGSNNIIEHNLE